MDDDFLKYGDQILLYSDSIHGYITTIGFNSPKILVQQCSKIHCSHIPNIRSMVFQVNPKLGYDPMRELRREKKAIHQRAMSKQLDCGGDDVQQDAMKNEILLQHEKTRMLEKRIEQQTTNNNRWIRKQRGKRILYGTSIQMMHVDSGMYLQYSKKSSQCDRQCQSVELVNDPSAQRVCFIIQQRYRYRQDGEAVVFNDHILLYNMKYNCYIHISEDYIMDQEKIDSKPSKYRPMSPMRRQNPEQIFKSLELNCSENFYKWQVINYRQQQPKDLPKFIFSGDILRLKHAETQGYLAFDDISLKKPAKNAYVRIYKGQDENDIHTVNNLFEIEAHEDKRLDTAESSGMELEWTQKGQAQSCLVRLRHLNSGKLLTLKTFEKKIKSKKNAQKVQKQLVLTIADNISPDEVNFRIDKIDAIEKENQYNPNFNKMTNQDIQRISRGVKPEQVFEIENTIVDTQTRVKNLSVVKITNKHFGVTISTEIKKLEGDEQQEEDEEEEGEEEAISQSQTQTQGQSEAPSNAVDEFLEIEENSIYRQAENNKEENKEHEIDPNKYTAMTYDETEFLIVNVTKMVKNGTMDDVYILEKVQKNEVEQILFIHSCVPMIKEFTYNLRYNHAVLTSPYMKSFEELLSQLIFFVIETDTQDPFKADGQPHIKSQKYLREIKFIDLLIDILIYPFEGENPLFDLSLLTQKSPVTRVCQLIYRLIKHTVKDNDFNKFYSAQWISHFFHQSMMTTNKNNLMADATTTEILQNNKVLLDKQINTTVIKNIVENCAKSSKNERFLKLLSALCSCNGEAITTNQDDICDLLLKVDGNEFAEFEDLLIEIQEKPNQGELLGHLAIIKDEQQYCKDGNPLLIEVQDLQKFFANDNRLYLYFESMCELISLMCIQRNYKGIFALEKMYTIDFALDCFMNTNIPYKLRANMGKILISLHIDKEPYEPINIPVLTRVWQEIEKAKTNLVQSRVQINPKLLKLKDFTVNFFLDVNGVQRAYENEKNMLSLQVLNTVEIMINLGFYQNEVELIQIINPIISLLDGSNDFSTKAEEEAFIIFIENQKNDEANKKKKTIESVFKKDKKLRYRNNENNLIIFAIKRKIIQILSKAIDIQNDVRLTSFLIQFQQSDAQLMTSPAQSGIELNFINNVLQGFSFDEEELEFKEKIDSKVINWMKIAYINKSIDMRAQSEKDLICILLDIILYNDSIMVTSAFTLLAKYFQQKRDIINYNKMVQILQDDQEVGILKIVSREVRQMKKDAEGSEFWMGKGDDRSALKQSRQFITKLEMLTDLSIHKPDRVIDIDDKKKKKDEDEGENQEEDDFLNISELQAEWDNEDPKICDEDELNDYKIQTLLRNQQAHYVPIIIIRQSGLESAEDKNSYLRVLEKCYIFLIKFVRNNKENQLELTNYLSLFIDDMEFGVHSWELICEIFRNSDQLRTYNLVPIIKKAIKIIDNLPKETQKKTILTSFLIYFITYNNNQVKQNQILICQEMTSQSRKNLDHLFVGESGLSDLHLYMLEMKNSYMEFMGDERFLQEIQIPPELCYTMEYIKLLAKCGEGKNSNTESIASDKLPLSDLIRNMEMCDFCYPLKSSLVYFMDSIYFDVEKDVSEENIGKMNKVIKIIIKDFDRFHEIQQRVKSSKGQQPGKRLAIVEQTEMEDLDGIYVDINKNFNMLTAFGSIPIVILIEKYIFEICYPAISNYFNLRLLINNDDKEVFINFLSLIQKSVSYCKKDLHFENAKKLFKTIKSIPSLKEYGSENLQNKILSMWIENNDLKINAQKKDNKAEMGMMMEIPNLSQAQKLTGYLQSVSSSDKLMKEFETEFEEIVQYIIQIPTKSKKAFNGLNTLDVKELIQSLIAVSAVGTGIEANLRIICLKVFRKIIEMEVPSQQRPSSEWDSSDWDKYEREIEKQQNILINLGVIHLLCDLIAYDEKRTIKEESILVGIACLLGGNYMSQMGFCNFINQDINNQFIVSLKEMLHESLESMRNHQSRRNEVKNKLIQIDTRIEELESLEVKTRLLNTELNKCIESKRLLEEELLTTEFDKNENPAAYTTNELTVRRSIDNSKIILRFMQLLCENHNPSLQNILREQLTEEGRTKSNSQDLCTFLSKSLEQFQLYINDQTFDVCNQLVDTLIEIIQGPCKPNQRALVNAKIIDSSREYIGGFESVHELAPLGFETEEQIDEIGSFKQNVVTLLTSLIEGQVDIEIVQLMVNSLDFETMKNRMLNVFKRFAEQILDKTNLVVREIPFKKIFDKLQKDSFETSVAEAFEIYILLHSLADSNSIAEEMLSQQYFNLDQWKAMDFIRLNTGRIEINVEGQLLRVYFPIKPVCRYMSPGVRKQLMNSVDRDNWQTKIESLIGEVDNLNEEMEHNERLRQAIIQITPDRLNALKDFSTVIGIFINVIFLFSSRQYHYRELYIEDWIIDSIEYLGYVQGASSFILIFFFAINKKNLITQTKWRELNQANKGFYELMANEERLLVNEMCFEQTHLILMLKGPFATEFQNIEATNVFGNFFTWSEFQILNVYFFIQDSTFQYYVLYFGISLLGKSSSNIYYSFHLLDVINRSIVLQNVVLAITSNIAQVGLTTILMMIIIYIYCTFTFFYIQEGMYDFGINGYDSDIVGENNCPDMFQCYVTMLDKGMRMGGGIGDISMVIHYKDDKEYYMVKLVHDASFQIVINITCLNIIFGIIVNSFASLRDTIQRNQIDMTTVCYICSIEKLIFDNNSKGGQGGFYQHIEKDHNLWQYVFYIVHLNSKDSSDFTGVESIVFSLLEEENPCWIPRMTALCLDKRNEEDDDDAEADKIQKEISNWYSRLQDIQSALCSVETKLLKIEKEKEEASKIQEEEKLNEQK